MEKAIRASNTPYAISVESGKTYYWCACGKSKGQPFCDGSHAGTGFNPVKYDAVESKTVTSVIMALVLFLRACIMLMKK